MYPLRAGRAGETAGCIASVTGLTVQADARLRERLNWDGSIPWEAFGDLWASTADDRDLVPGGGQSARHAAARLQAFLAGLRGLRGPVAAVTHPPAGAFYLFPHCGALLGRRTGDGMVLRTDEDVALYLLDAADVATVHGAAYGLSPHFRISFATSEKVLENAITRIAAAVANLR